MRDGGDERPVVDVRPAEYLRLLGYPPGWQLRDRPLELAAWARDWYDAHGAPRLRTRHAEVQLGGAVYLGGVPFHSRRLLRLFTDAGAHRAMLAAITAGPELEAEAQRLWLDGKPDEYFFLEMYGSAVVEHLVTMAGARYCAWAEPEGMAVLPHDSPGYPEWPIEEQGKLWALLSGPRFGGPEGPPYVGTEDGPTENAPYVGRTFRSGESAFLEVLDSGMLRPKKSLLAVFGVTRHVDRVRQLTDLIPCEICSFLPCQFRRVPYRRDGASEAVESARPARSTYTVNSKALDRWARERLSFDRRDDTGVEATFRYDGTTCSNMGRPIAFEYRICLGPRAEGYPILAQRCAPAPGDEGHTLMCRYISHRDELLGAIAREAPLAGCPLGEVTGWARPPCATGCYCDEAARAHKWGLVLETLHYALGKER